MPRTHTSSSPSRIETQSAEDRFFNYCLWEYAPRAAPAGKLHPATLLYHSFDLAGVGPRAFELVDRIRAAIGRDRTVYGIKQTPTGLSWEFYFYDYRRRQRERSLPVVLEAIAPLLQCPVQPPEDLPYFMFSLDFTPALLADATSLDELHVYIGNVGSAVSSGMNFSCTTAGRVLENFYFFFDAKKHRDDIVGKITSSGFHDLPTADPARILWPELIECDTICVANKRRNDCIYFSGVDVGQLLFFMERLGYPAPLAAYIREQSGQLDHLLFDVGYDYTLDADGLHLLKSGYYGVF